MKKREKFQPGAKRPSKANIDAELGFGKSKSSPIKERFDSPLIEEEDLPKSKSIYLRDIGCDIVEKIKNIVYTEKINGDPYANQSSVVNKALQEYVSNYKTTIVERPEFVKELEKRKSKTI